MRPRPTRRPAALFALALLPALALAPSAFAGPPVRLVFDTDICGDCDDVLALGMIHALQSRDACTLLAVTTSADHDLAAPFVNAVNTFYNRPSVPIGAVKDGVVARSKYLALADARDGGAPRYPHALASGENAPDAVTLLRATLAAQPDGSVVIAQVGFFTNLSRLLDSKPDDASPLRGDELVRKKVKLLSLMAGAFRPVDGNANYKEYNVVQDIPAARHLADRWPSPMVWSGFEIGIALPYPSTSILRDYTYVKHHPLAEAYTLHEPPPHDRPTWDLTSVLYAVYPDRGYFDLSPSGEVTVGHDGVTGFEPKANGRSRYLILKPEQKPRVLEALVQLSSQPPGPAAAPQR